MNMLKHVSINLFPIVMLLIIYRNNQKKMTNSPDKRQFNLLILFTIAFMISGILCYGFAGTDWSGNHIHLWIFRMLYIELAVGVASVWLIYVCSRLQLGGKRIGRQITRLIWGMNVLIGVLVVTTPWTHFLFYITDSGEYAAGQFYYLSRVSSLSMLLISIVVAVLEYRQTASRDRRQEAYYLAICGIIPFVGFGIQSLWSEWWLGAPCLSLSILFIYLNSQNRQITMDSLTGLNNRREFDQYIEKKASQSHGDNWGLLMLDVDDFKSINDKLGHIVGDEALWNTADILRHTLGKDKTFLARYGGDEFVVIGDWEDAKEARRAIERIGQEAVRFNREAQKKYQLSFSIGYAMWAEVADIEKLVNKADERMYEEKKRKKSERFERNTKQSQEDK